MTSLIKDKLSRSPRNSLDSDNAPADQEADKYRLLVTAGPSYDTSTHKIVHVNTVRPTVVSNSFLTASIKVRIRGYRGLPSRSPPTSAYFANAIHTRDQYSIAFSFVPKVDLPSVDTVWGNDFDHPVRDRLPPGFNTAFKIVKEFIDPGLECDAYADEPWLYGPSLSCWFAFGMGDKNNDDAEALGNEKDEASDVLQEGASSPSDASIRSKLSIPTNNEKRRKYFLSRANREAFTFEAGRTYHGDFYNPYLDFGNFALKLPGFSIKVIKYIDEKSHRLRYVFKNRKTGDVYFCINLNLLWGEELKRALEDEKKEVERFAGAENEGDVNGIEGGIAVDGEVNGTTGFSTRRRSTKDGKEFPSVSNTAVPEIRLEAEPGLRDKPPELVDEVKKMSIEDRLRNTASADNRGESGVLDDLD